MKELTGLASLALGVWGIYLTIKIAEFVHAWPF